MLVSGEYKQAIMKSLYSNLSLLGHKLEWQLLGLFDFDKKTNINFNKTFWTVVKPFK